MKKSVHYIKYQSLAFSAMAFGALIFRDYLNINIPELELYLVALGLFAISIYFLLRIISNWHFEEEKVKSE